MAGNFWYPYHWSDLAPEAFVQAQIDHDAHGFGSDFVARQEDRDRYLEDYLNGLSAGSGKRFATVVVAASNSLHHAAADADFVCTGTADDVTLQAAVNKADTAAAFGGGVVLLDGDFYLSANSSVTNTNTLSSLIGQGSEVTTIHVPARTSNATIGCLNQFTRIAHLNFIFDADQTFDFFGITNTGIVEDVMFFCQNRLMTAASYLIAAFNSGNQGRVAGVQTSQCTHGNGILLGAGGSLIEVFGNQIECAGISLDVASANHMVFGNQFLAGNPAVRIAGAGATDVSLLGNVIRANSSATDIVSVAGTRANVQMNKLLPSGTLATNGMHVVAAATDAFVTNNDLKGCATNVFVNAGTGTITTAGNRT